MENMRRAFSALGNKKRLEIIVALLESGEGTVAEIANRHGIHDTVASRHLGKLGIAGLVRGTRQGRYVHYSADTASPSKAIRNILNVIDKSPKRRTI